MNVSAAEVAKVTRPIFFQSKSIFSSLQFGGLSGLSEEKRKAIILSLLKVGLSLIEVVLLA